MGHFHDTSDPLHGVTVVVETHASEIWVGRCNRIEEGRVLLFESDRFVDGEAAQDRDAWLQRVAMVGFHPNYPKVDVPAEEVKSVRPLMEYA